MKAPTDPPFSPLVAIVGPTASGKSSLALALARKRKGEIVNYDSVQVFKYFDIGTAKPPLDERRTVPHHLIDLLEPDETFTAGEFARRARAVLDQIRDRQRLPILVGGTGLYLRALLDGLFEGPQRNEPIRRRLRELVQQRGAPHLHQLLTQWDPEAADRIAPQDSHRLIRALEIFLATRTSQSEFFRQPRQALRGFRVLKIGLNPSRQELYTRINDRVSKMYDQGLLKESKEILVRGTKPEVKAFQSLGYRQALRVIQGELGFEEAQHETQQATRRYAKRQMTWFRKDAGITWFPGFGDDVALQQQILDFLKFCFRSWEPF